jgi:hypothetical protein
MQDERAKSELIRAARLILRPLVRQLIAHGLTFPAFSRLVKEVYIEVATRHFSLPFKKQTDSRVALVTGITRKEIGQLRRGQVTPLAEAAHIDYGLASRVIGRWVAEKPYLATDGTPRSLPYETASGDPSFMTLVGEIGGDIPPRAVLDELIRVGAVTLTAEGGVELLATAYIPARGTEEKLAILGVDASELIGAISHNIDHPEAEPFLQRKVWYDNIGARALPELRHKIREAGTGFVQEVNQVIASYDRDRNPGAPGGGRKRVVLGVYYFEEDYEPPQVEPEREDTAAGKRKRGPRQKS